MMLSGNPSLGESLNEQHREQLQRLVQQPPLLERAARFAWRVLLRALGVALLSVGRLLLNQTQSAPERPSPADLLPLTSLPND